MPTTAADPRAFVARRDEEARRAVSEAARARLPAAAAHLREHHGVEHVWLFGSFAEGREDPTSDVDLAVDHLPGSALFGALSELMGILRCPVDRVDLSDAPESLRVHVRETGVPL